MEMLDDIHPAPLPTLTANGAFVPGIRFGMNEDEYFSIPALSASGVKLLRRSALDFWARTEWLGKTAETEEPEESFHRIVGRAYHARLLEGRDVFFSRYAPAISKSDYKDLLVTTDDLKGELERLGLPKTVKRKQDSIDRILDADPTAGSRIWDVLEDGYTKNHPGKIFLPADLCSKIELSAAMIERNKYLGQAFKGGMPEVAIFWYDEITGCPCKAKLDYWKPKAIVDLKTFENNMGREVVRAVDYEFANNRYAFQGCFYMQAVEAAISLIHAGAVSGDVDPAFLKKVISANPDDRKMLFVFQQKGPAPLAVGKTFNKYSATYRICAAHLETARQSYVQYMETFGKDPWVYEAPIEEFQDSEVPQWATE